MSTDKDGKASPPSNRKDVAYSINSYEDTRNANVQVSYDPTDYIQKARVTRALPPKPAYDPLQFVQLKPCSLVKTAQEQMKKVDDIKKIKDEKKEEPEEWQCNLDNWKSSRRKRVEHIIDRVVEVKKFELEEHDRNRRKSKTFNEMMEERCSRRLKYLPIYTDDDNNDLSDLGINTADPSNQTPDNNSEDTQKTSTKETSTDTDLKQYTYEGAIEDYKSRISRATNVTTENSQRSENNANQRSFLGATKNTGNFYKEARSTIRDETNSFETLLPEVPKIEVSKRKEIFEKEQGQPSESESRRQSSDFINTLSIKERLSVLQLNQAQEPNESEKQQKTIPDVSFTDLKNRLEIFEREIRTLTYDKEDNSKSSPHKSSVETSKVLQPDMKHTSPSPDKPKDGNAPFDKSPYLSSSCNDILKQKANLELDENENIDTDREDSGIHTTDVSCSVSQADDQNEEIEQLTNEDSDIKTEETVLKVQSSVVMEEVTHVETDEANDINILDDALEMAFQEIDNMESTAPQPVTSNTQEPIYQNISDINDILPQNTDVGTFAEIEPYYQVPKSQEPYYEVPKTKPIPLYENVDIMQSVNIISEGDIGTNFTISLNHLEPPKEKPPPPPVDTKQDAAGCNDSAASNSSENFKRINSTKRIKKELQHKRSSFLGIDIETADGDRLLNFPTTPPSRSVASFLQEEKQLEKQYLMKTGLYEHSDAAESRDSGVSENHSRQSSDLFTTSSDDPEELIKPKIGENKLSKYRVHHNSSNSSNNCFLQVDDEFRYQITDSPSRQPEDMTNPIPPPIPPAKPLRSPQYLQNQFNVYREHSKSLSNVSNIEYSELQSSKASPSETNIAYTNACANISTFSNEILPLCDPTRLHNNLHVTESGLDLTSCASKLKAPNEWAQYRMSHDSKEFVQEVYPSHSNMLQQRSLTECSPQWNVKTSRQVNRHSDSYARHWFVQEAEQRRIEQQQQAASNNYLSGYPPNKSIHRKSLPESVIQTITQRVQNLGIGSDRRWHPEGPYQANENGLKPEQFNKQNHQRSTEHDEKVLSVSGKKKCSHCSNELGRGAAMVIESLGLLYHIDCFKCCVCHIRLGDGFTGTDVRVRKFKLHCQNCFSSEDGVKFSCV